MNSAGDTQPCVGCRHRSRGLGTRDFPVLQHLWLVMQEELLSQKRSPQIGFERGTRRHRCLHRRIEKNDACAAGGLRLVHRKFRLL